jgi:N-acetylated-alpha-linked acidic dipeptidase
MTYEDLQDILLRIPDEGEAKRWSEYYTAGPHLAGKNLSQAIWTRDRWEELGVKSTIVTYDIYMNYPFDHRLALLEVGHKDLDFALADHKIIYECRLEEDVLDEDDTSGLKDRIPTFHGYSASGNVTAPYVFANFATWQDFEDLLAANVSLKGKIALAKYGHVFRGLKVKRAQELGMVGMVMYSDPQEDGEMIISNGHKPYPEGPARNPSSVQRGSTQFLSAYVLAVSSNHTHRCFRRAAGGPHHSRNSIQARRPPS